MKYCNIRIIMLVALAAGLMWGCGGERGMESSGVDEQIGRPLVLIVKDGKFEVFE